jgi:hypothetical protein
MFFRRLGSIRLDENRFDKPDRDGIVDVYTDNPVMSAIDLSPTGDLTVDLVK